MKYQVCGSYHQNNNIYNEELLGEFDTKEEAINLAKNQKNAWEQIIIYEDNNNDVQETWTEE